MSSTSNERIHNVSFEYIADSPYIRPLRMRYTRNGSELYWDMGLAHDSVTALLFHREKKCLLLVKQFRPAVFVQLVRKMAENKGKSVDEIDWSAYPIELGATLELCGGIMDKPAMSPEETMRVEIEEECGYHVPDLRLIKTYLAGVGMQGCMQHFYYAEIDDTMRVSEGGGNWKEGEVIENVFLSIPTAREMLNKDQEVQSVSGVLYALTWFFNTQSQHVAAS